MSPFFLIVLASFCYGPAFVDQAGIQNKTYGIACLILFLSEHYLTETLQINTCLIQPATLRNMDIAQVNAVCNSMVPGKNLNHVYLNFCHR